MKAVIYAFHTEVFPTCEEVNEVCRIGQGEKCCAFLTVGANGFECVRMNPSFSYQIFKRLEAGTMTAKGEGGWEGYHWEGEVQ